MLRTGVVLDPKFLDHTTPPGHPERVERMNALLEMYEQYEREGLVKLEPGAASEEEIGWNHDREHIENVATTAGGDYHAFDPDTHASAGSYETARLAAGGYLTLLEAIMEGEIDNGFALVRPPGHHAEVDRAMGFCLFNNVAIGAHWLKAKRDLKRILIVDWDVHHGNGTQRSFYTDASVLYISCHQYPFYPGTGAAIETGEGDGEGATVNVPLPAGCGDAEYGAVFEDIIVPIAHEFDPQFVLISAGFDAHVRDPLGAMDVTESGFAAMARRLMRIAADHAGGRCAAILEGGYDLNGLTQSTASVLDELGGTRMHEPIQSAGAPPSLLADIKEVHRRRWKL